MFIDDAAANIRDVQCVCCVLHVANQGGMDATHMSALTSWAKATGTRAGSGCTETELR